MRTPFIAGNWKMNLLRADAVSLAAALAEKCSGLRGVDVAVFPPYVYLEAVAGAVAASLVRVGAQNAHFENSGAFTGEVAAPMLADLGCQYVILGHSERRHIFGETDADVFRKAQAVLAAGLRPVICVGETLTEREDQRTQEVINTQFAGSISQLDEEQLARVTLAYEPVWAIGTGKNATPDQAEDVHADLRKLLATRYNAELAASTRILYGGSVKGDNAAGLLAQPNVDGALVGGASLKSDEFMKIIQAAVR